MSDNGKLYNIAINDNLKIIKTVIDFSVQNTAIGVYSVDSYIPEYHKLVDVDIFVDTALASGGSATLSIGFDDIASEPDNILNDEAVGSFTLGALVAGIPRLGTAATHLDTGATQGQLAYEIKVAALTSGVITVVQTFKPYK